MGINPSRAHERSSSPAGSHSGGHSGTYEGTQETSSSSSCSAGTGEGQPSTPMDWSLECSEGLAMWKYSAVLLGFDPRIDYTSSQKLRLQPWCTQGRYLTVKRTPSNGKSTADVNECRLSIVEGCFQQDTSIKLPSIYSSRLHSIPEPAGYYLKSVQVVGYREGIAVLQLICTGHQMEFMAVHMKTASVLAVHREEASKYYLCDCIISPDLSSFMLKPNSMYVLNFNRGEYKNCIKQLSCKQNRCPVLKTMFESTAVRMFIAYDPRYKSRRVALGNYPKHGRDIVVIYDLETDSVVTESRLGVYQTTHNITFSPDGIYLASLILGRSVKEGLFNFPRVLLYGTSDLRVLHVIRTDHLSEVPTLAPIALFPLFSETGTRLAVAYGQRGAFCDQVAGVNVYRVPVLLDLQSLCRLSIRLHFDCRDVERLPLPNKLKDFLRFRPSYG